jgi:uncharacterized glyoxalase superfamily protein PhnB
MAAFRSEHMRLNTFLNFGGNCEEAFRFYEQHLGGKITMLMRRAEQPNLRDPVWAAPGQVRDVLDDSRIEATDWREVMTACPRIERGVENR